MTQMSFPKTYFQTVVDKSLLLFVLMAVVRADDEYNCANMPGGKLMSYTLCLLTKGAGASAELTPGHADDLYYKRPMAILVPFRDRYEELHQFVPYMFDFLNKQDVRFHIFVIQQVDRLRWNKGALINAGFLETKNDFAYFAIHDVDTLPVSENLRYDYPVLGPVHIAAGLNQPNHTHVGGIVLIRRRHYEQIRGMSNRYWGWGEEDNDFGYRVRTAGLEIHKPVHVTRESYRLTHDETHHRRDFRRCYKQGGVPFEQDHTGLHNVNYTLRGIVSFTFAGHPITLVNIQLHCNMSDTPYCTCGPRVIKYWRRPEPSNPILRWLHRMKLY